MVYTKPEITTRPKQRRMPKRKFGSIANVPLVTQGKDAKPKSVGFQKLLNKYCKSLKYSRNNKISIIAPCPYALL